MGFFDATKAALAAGNVVGLAVLAEFDFVEGVSRFWLTGVGTIEAGGHEWTGAGDLVALENITTGEGDDADKLVFTLSGVNAELLALAQQAGSVRGRTVTLYGQFLDVQTQQPVSGLWALPTADIMDTIGFAAAGPSTRSIRLTAETIWTARNTAKNAFYSDRDQAARFPGDKGLEFVSGMVSNSINWPVYSGS